jgi:hypothetical protein
MYHDGLMLHASLQLTAASATRVWSLERGMIEAGPSPPHYLTKKQM